MQSSQIINHNYLEVLTMYVCIYSIYIFAHTNLYIYLCVIHIVYVLYYTVVLYSFFYLMLWCSYLLGTNKGLSYKHIFISYNHLAILVILLNQKYQVLHLGWQSQLFV